MPETVRINVPCVDCGNAFETALFMGHQVGKYCRNCMDSRDRALEFQRHESHEKSLAFHRREWLHDPKRGIPMKYWELTWEDFRFDRGGEGNRPKAERFRAYSQTFPVHERPIGQPSLLLARDVNGVGKTMLACLMLKDIIGRFENLGFENCPYQFWAASDIKLRIKAAQRFGSRETEEDVYRDYGTMWLLVIDDVGKESLSGPDAALVTEMYFTILNRRYNNGLPVILTSNLDFAPWRDSGPTLVDLMGAAPVSRLMEMTGGYSWLIEGEDRR